jgi:hypothetical protein
VKKPRPDSRLKTLPEERQEAIADYARTHSLEDTVAWLADGSGGCPVVTSSAALSGFLSWWALEQQLSRNESTVETVLAQLKVTNPELTERQLSIAGQSFFSALALQNQDAKAWFLSQTLALKKEQLGLDREKFQVTTCELFLKWLKDQRAVEIAEGKATNSEKISRLGELMFGEEWSTAVEGNAGQ